MNSHRHLFSLVCAYHELSDAGMPHIQATVIFTNTIRRGPTLKNLLCQCVHWEVLANEKKSLEYCRKGGSPDHIDFDSRRQGARSDLADLATLVAADPANAVSAVATQFPGMFMRYHAGVAALSRALQPVPPVRMERRCRWYWGAAGCGKTFTAIAEASAISDSIFIWNNGNLKFPDNYKGETCVVFDDLRTNWEGFTYSRLLTLLGTERASVEAKGVPGGVWWRATDIWVTTPSAPDDFLTADERRKAGVAGYNQLRRRLTPPEGRQFDVVHADAFAVDRFAAAAAAICPDSAPVSPRATPPLPPAPAPVSDDEPVEVPMGGCTSPGAGPGLGHCPPMVIRYGRHPDESEDEGFLASPACTSRPSSR